jgi:hypothetical protein
MGGLAGGLASGALQGKQLQMQKEYYQGLNDYRKSKLKEGDGGGSAKKTGDTDFTDFDNSVLPLFGTIGRAPGISSTPQQPVMMNPEFERMPGFATGGLVTLEKKKRPVIKGSSGGLAMLAKGRV